LPSVDGEKILKTISESKISILENLKEFFENVRNLEGEIWIGKKDFLLSKIKARGNSI